jgi:hypothetical protein
MIKRHGQDYNRKIRPKRQELGQDKKGTGSFDRGFK